MLSFLFPSFGHCPFMFYALDLSQFFFLLLMIETTDLLFIMTFCRWDSGSTVGEFDGHSRRVLSCAFKPSRPYRIITCGEDFLVNFYEGPPFKFKQSQRLFLYYSRRLHMPILCSLHEFNLHVIWHWFTYKKIVIWSRMVSMSNFLLGVRRRGRRLDGCAT